MATATSGSGFGSGHGKIENPFLEQSMLANNLPTVMVSVTHKNRDVVFVDDIFIQCANKAAATAAAETYNVVVRTKSHSSAFGSPWASRAYFREMFATNGKVGVIAVVNAHIRAQAETKIITNINVSLFVDGAKTFPKASMAFHIPVKSVIIEDYTKKEMLQAFEVVDDMLNCLCNACSVSSLQDAQDAPPPACQARKRPRTEEM